MSVMVQIGSETRSLDDASPSWINDQINRRRRDGASFCVRVTIDNPPIDLALSTPGCSGGGGGGRRLNTQEEEIADLWRKHYLSDEAFSGGSLVSFLKQIGKWFK
jgi:hypothetical protein